MIIYKATNIKNNKIYIGATIRTLNERKSQHISCALRNADNNNRYFYNAIRKNGPENFIWEIIDSAEDYETLMEKEKYWIKYYNSFGKNGYNSCEGGNNTIGYRHSKETLQKLREIAKNREVKRGSESPFFGKKMPEETKQKLREKLSGENNPMKYKTFYDVWNEKYDKETVEEKIKQLKEKLKLKAKNGKEHRCYGTHLTEETRNKISESLLEYYKTHENANKNKTVHSEEQKEKWSQQRKGRKLEGEWLENIREARKAIRKKVINLDTLVVYDSIGLAQEAYGLKNGISNVCKGKKKTAAGQRWQYYDDYLKENNIENNNNND